MSALSETQGRTVGLSWEVRRTLRTAAEQTGRAVGRAGIFLGWTWTLSY